MCGIAGIVSLEGKPVFEREVRDMCMAIAHRGPDDEGFYLSSEAGVGMRRLSIIDPACGGPPARKGERSAFGVFYCEDFKFSGLRPPLPGLWDEFSYRH